MNPKTFLPALAILWLFTSAVYAESPAETKAFIARCRGLIQYGDRNSFDKENKIDAIHALGLYGGDENALFLGPLIQDEQDEHARYEMARALGWMHSKQATPFLIRMLTSEPYEHARTQAVLALGKIKDPRSVEPLEKYAETLKPEERDRVISALQNITGKNYARLMPQSKNETIDDSQGKATDFFVLAVKAQQAGEIDVGIDNIRKAILQKPENWNYHMLLAMLMKAKGDFPQARASLITVEKLNPTYGGSYVLRAEMALTDGDQKQALENYRKSLGLNLNPKTRISVAARRDCQVG